MPTDTQERIKELLAILKKDGANLIEVDGRPLSQIAKELEQEVSNLKQENAALKQGDFLTFEKLKEIFGEKNFDKKGIYKGVASTSDQQSTKPDDVVVDPSKPVGKPSWSTGFDEIDKGWANFFAAHSTITEQDKPNWVKTASLSGADATYNNGWTALTPQAGITNINNDNHTVDYTQEGITIKDIKLSTTPKSQIVTQIQQEKAWRSFFAAHSDINNQADWKKIGVSPSEAETVHNNGWKDQIKNIESKVIAVYEESGEKVLNIDVLSVALEPLKKSCALMADIKKQTSLHDIIPTYKKTEIEELAKSDNKLPADYKSADLIKQRETVRGGLWFNLTSTDPRDEGIASELLSLAETEEKNVWEIRKYDPLNPEILNEALNACEGIDGLQAGGEGDGENIDQFLKDQGGYNIDEKEPGIEAKEAVLPKETRGTYLLPLFYKMNNYDYKNPEFCQWVKVKRLNETSKEVDIAVLIDTTTKDDVENPDNPKRFTEASLKQLKEIFAKGIKGQWAIGTGVGKTTKSMNCLLEILRQLKQTLGLAPDVPAPNIILVCPTAALVQSAHNHHKSWLQTWGCVIHAEKIGTRPDGSDIYKSHGGYKVEHNKYQPEGICVMEPHYLFAHLAATLCDTSFLDSSKGGKNMTDEQKTEFEANVAKIKDYVIPDGTCIVFDEADFAIPEYQALIRGTTLLTKDDGTPKYRVIKMSATFKGQPFSITSSFDIESRYLTGFASGTDLKLEERLSKMKSLLFLKSTANKQIKSMIEVLKKGAGENGTGNGVCHVVYDSTYEAYMEGISFGLPKGSIGIGDNRYGRGFTPDVDNTISTGYIEQTVLGDFGKYSKPATQSYPTADGVQQRGRSGRFKDGKWYTTSTTFEEIKIVPDLTSDMVKAVVEGSISAGLKKLGSSYDSMKFPKSNVVKGANFVRAGIALRMIMMKGVAPRPEYMVVGLGGLPEFPKFRSDTDANGNIYKDGDKNSTKPPWKDMDKGLWESYMGRPDPNAPKLDIPRAKDLLKLMIQTYISNDPDFPKRLEIKMISSLVEKTKLNEAEARQVLNALIVKKIEEAIKEDPTYEPINKRGKTLSTIQHIAALHKVVLAADKGGTKISMGIEKNEDGDDEYVLRMEYNVASPTKKRFVLFDEKFQEIRNLIRGEFKGKIKEEADKALRVDSLKGYLMFVKELSENADLYNELVRQKRDEDNANKFLYRIEELVKGIETTQSEAKIEETSQLEAKIEIVE